MLLYASKYERQLKRQPTGSATPGLLRSLAPADPGRGRGSKLGQSPCLHLEP